MTKKRDRHCYKYCNREVESARNADEKTICLEWDSMSGIRHQLRSRKSKKKRCKTNYRKSRKRRKQSKVGKSKRAHQKSKMYKQNSYQDKYYTCKRNGSNKESPKVNVIQSKKSYSKKKNITMEKFSMSRKTPKNLKKITNYNSGQSSRGRQATTASLELSRRLKTRRESIMDETFGELTGIMNKSQSLKNNSYSNLDNEIGEKKLDDDDGVINDENETGLTQSRKNSENIKSLKQEISLLERELANSKQDNAALSGDYVSICKHNTALMAEIKGVKINFQEK